MTLQEFRAWFEGYTENISGVPSAKQWTRIKARVAEIDGVITTQTVFVKTHYPNWYSLPQVGPMVIPNFLYGQAVGNTAPHDVSAHNGFNPTSAMLCMGKSDAQADIM